MLVKTLMLGKSFWNNHKNAKFLIVLSFFCFVIFLFSFQVAQATHLDYTCTFIHYGTSSCNLPTVGSPRECRSSNLSAGTCVSNFPSAGQSYLVAGCSLCASGCSDSTGNCFVPTPTPGPTVGPTPTPGPMPTVTPVPPPSGGSFRARTRTAEGVRDRGTGQLFLVSGRTCSDVASNWSSLASSGFGSTDDTRAFNTKSTFDASYYTNGVCHSNLVSHIYIRDRLMAGDGRSFFCYAWYRGRDNQSLGSGCTSIRDPGDAGWGWWEWYWSFTYLNGLSENGTYYVDWTIDNNTGRIFSDRDTFLMTNIPGPVASFTSSSSSGDAPLQVFFSNTTSFPGPFLPTTYSWDFGDGGSSSSWSPSYTYTTPGTYTVTLTATNINDTTTATDTITVTAPLLPPSITFTTDKTQIEVGETATLIWSVTDATSCTGSGDWQGGNPKTLPAGTESFTPIALGSGSANFSLDCDGPGGSTSASVAISITDITAPTITSLIVDGQNSPPIPFSSFPLINTSGIVSITVTAPDTGGDNVSIIRLRRTPDDGTGKPNTATWLTVGTRFVFPPSFTWTFINPAAKNPGDGLWWYGVEVTDESGNEIDETGAHIGGVSSDAFDPRVSVGPIQILVDTTPPTVSFDSPAAAFWFSQDFDIQYDATDASIDTCELFTRERGGPLISRGAIPCGSNQTRTISVGPGGWCTVQFRNSCGVLIEATDIVGNKTIGARFFSIDYTAPVVTDFQVDGTLFPSNVVTSSDPSITGSVSEFSFGGGIVAVELWRGIDTDGDNLPDDWSGSPFQTQSFVNLITTAFSFTDSPSNGTFWYGIHVIDRAGNCITEVGGHCGGVSSDTEDVNRAVVGPIAVVKPPPAASFVVSPSSGQSPLPVTLTVTSVSVDKWVWDFGDGTSCDSTINFACSSGDTTHTFVVSGTTLVPYTITLTGTNSFLGTSVIHTETVQVLPPTSADFTISLNPLSAIEPVDATFTDASISADTWDWDIDSDGSIDFTGPGPHSQNYPSAGTYSVTLVVTNSTLAVNATITKTFQVLVDQFPNISILHVPSTPTQKNDVTFTANAQDGLSLASVSIEASVAGSVVASQTCSASGLAFSCSVNHGPFLIGTQVDYKGIVVDSKGQTRTDTASFIVAGTGGLVSCGRSTDDPATAIVESDPCGFCDVFRLSKNILDIFLFPFVPIIGGLLFAVGGFILFTGGGNPQSVNRGRSIIIATLIGVTIVYTSWVFISLFLTFMGVATWTGPGGWWQIAC